MLLVRAGYSDNQYTNKIRLEFDRQNEKIVTQQIKNCNILLGDSMIKSLPIEKLQGGPTIKRGISGDTLDNIANRVFADAIQLKPKKVYIMGGINDINIWVKRCAIFHQHDECTIIKQIITNLLNIVQRIIYNNIKVYVISLLPLARTLPDFNNKYANALIVSVNDKLEKRIKPITNAYYVDCSDVFFKKDVLMSLLQEDGFHLSDAGYDVLIKKINATM